jgi:uncharacterized membrane protein
LVDRLGYLMDVRGFSSFGAAECRSTQSQSYARMKEFVRRSTCAPFRRFIGDVRREIMHRLLLWPFIASMFHTFVTPCMMAVLLLLFAFLIRSLVRVCFFPPFVLVVSTAFLVIIHFCNITDTNMLCVSQLSSIT